MSFIVKSNKFIIETKSLHYAIGVGKFGAVQLHFGRKCSPEDYEIPNYSENNSNHSAFDYVKTEYAVFGGALYRECAFKCTFADGCRDTSLEYDSYIIEDNTLKIKLKDRHYPLEITLIYKTFDGFDIIERSAEIKNTGAEDIILEKAASAEIALPSLRPYEIINANGAWAQEFCEARQTLESGEIVFESRKGTTSHCHIPALIASQNATEDSGEVYFAALGWGGSFKISAERDFTGTTRAVLGINDFDFSKTLKGNESFATPPVYCSMANGLGEMSNMLSEFAVNHILPKRYAKEPLPVLYNSWEATAFDVDEADQMRLAEIAAEIGCELFVMDDGWFGERSSDWAGLGDWTVNREKFPNGLAPLIKRVNELGMDFGLWFEPEMVNPDSELYRRHPDWTYHYDTREATLLRHQLVLNITKPEVKEYIFNCINDMLCEYNIKYIKWDMNRPFSEIGAENLENPKEFWIRHTQAVFEIADRIREAHPDIQFEACSSGGGRTDLGALAHFDMVWPSDNTDPLDRLEIQHGYSLVYPIKCMRTWVTDSNGGTRPVPLQYRLAVSMQGALSIGSNLKCYGEKELEECKKYIALYKKIRQTIQFGRLYRIMNFKEDKIYLNCYVSQDKSEAVLFACAGTNSFFGGRFVNVKFKGLDENAVYKVNSEYRSFTKSGAYLMNRGIDIDYCKPFDSEIFVAEKI